LKEKKREEEEEEERRREKGTKGQTRFEVCPADRRQKT